MLIKSFIILIAICCGSVSAQAQINYDPYREILEEYNRDGFVDYRALKESGDAGKLEGFLNEAGQIPLDELSKPEAKALLINLYNGWTISLILDHYPVSSIRDIEDPWSTPFCLADGKRYSLDQIEKEILLKEYFDARFHFVLNCAAASCPPLLKRPFTGDALETALERAAEDFINSREYNRFSVETRRKGLKRVKTVKAEISEIFKWYRNDFEVQYGSLAAVLAAYTRDPEVTSLLEKKQLETVYNTYDWSLNEPQAR